MSQFHFRQLRSRQYCSILQKNRKKPGTCFKTQKHKINVRTFWHVQLSGDSEDSALKKGANNVILNQFEILQLYRAVSPPRNLIKTVHLTFHQCGVEQMTTEL